MHPYTGYYTEQRKNEKYKFSYYTFTPRPLKGATLFKMDDELAALLVEAHHNLGLLEGLLQFDPNKNSFCELMLLKECTYSRMIDYDSISKSVCYITKVQSNYARKQCHKKSSMEIRLS